ncbi:mitochondrial ribosomal protein L37-domain-containing protein [Mucidula mucida]|nr:mitochondrial ribosomal protein L37-domain-containing protein [Mucidula mucida]
MFLHACTRPLRRLATPCRTVVRAYAAPAPPKAKPAAFVAPKSSCAADTILEGLNYLKDQPPILAKPDEEYPDWLWTVMENKVLPDDGPGGKKERYERRLDNKKKLREHNFMLTQK